MDIIVLGAGVIGVTTAYYLARDGHDVTVIDRQQQAGMETSFANGSQIAAHGAGPWSAPGVPMNLLRWLGRDDAPFLLRLRALPGLLRWGPKFLRNCTEQHWRDNARAINDLASLSLDELGTVVRDNAIEYDALKRGILVIHRTQQGFDAGAAKVERNRAVGFRQTVLNRDQCVEVEPALEPVASGIAGGIYSPDDETGDCLKFTQALAEICKRLGVRFMFGTTIEGFVGERGTVSGVRAGGRTIAAERVILCLGSYTAPMARALGLRLPIYPVKGYSATVAVDGWNGAPSVSLIDDQRRMGFSRLGNRLRMAGTAEFCGFDRRLNARRSEMLMHGLREMFPSFPANRPAEQWTGLRPMTPDGRPLLGSAGPRNLLVNSGHGTLGWTLACGSARVVRDLVAARPSPLSLDAFSPLRAS
jgi:D-amino-acid dehydrogenase